MIQPSLFEPPALPEPTREERQSVLAALPGTPVIRERIVPTARLDPCGHLAGCQDPDCAACTILRLDFAQCLCGRWGARAVLYGGRCFGCHNAAHGEFDGREDRYFWRAPAGVA